MSLLFALLSGLSIPFSHKNISLDLLILGFEAGTCIGLLILLRRGYLHLAGGLYLAILWVLTLYLMIGTGGVGTPVYPSFLLVLFLSSTIFGWRVALGLALLSTVAGFQVYRWELAGTLAPPFIPLSLFTAWAISSFIFFLAIGVLLLYERSMKRALIEARRAAESQQRKERELSFLLDNLPDMVWQKDLDSRFVMVNRRFAEEAGHPAAYLIGKTDADFWPEPIAQKHLASDRQVIETGELFVSEELVPTHDGQECWIETVKRPIFDEDGAVSGTVGVARDITDRRMAEQAVAESEEKYRLLFTTARDAIILVDAETRQIVDANAMTSRIYGYEREELLGMPAVALSAEPEVSTAYIEATSSLPPLETEFALRQHRKKDGTVFPVELSTGQLTIGGKRMIIGAFRDVTERVTYEKALRESEARFRELIEQSPLSTILYDTSGKPTLANLAAAKMANLTPEGQQYMLEHYNIFDDPVLEAHGVSHLVKQAFQGNYVEFPPLLYDAAENPRIAHVASGKQWLQTTMYPVRNAENDIREIAVMHQIVTERMEAEAALRESELFLRRIVEDQTEFIVRWLPDGTRTFVNDSYCRFFGQTKEEILRTNLYPMLREEDQEDVRRKIYSLTPDQPAKVSEYQLRRHDGALRWTQWNARGFFDEHGNLVELLSVGQDITERKVAAERQEAALREKEVMLKEIHHRVKNNLQIVSSLLTLQGRYLTDEHAQSTLLESRNRINSMALIHEKLYQSSDLAKIDFAAYTKDILAEILHSFRVHNRRIETEVAIENVQLNIELAIPCALILNELVSNALKHAFPGRKHGRIQIFMAQVENEYRLTVADNGVGLPPQMDLFAGESLGLQLVKTLTDQLGGGLAVNSTQGTAVEIRFPVPVYAPLQT